MNQPTTFHDLLDPARPLRVSELTRLSNLDEDEGLLFAIALRELSVDRRSQLAQALVDLAEDSAILTFDAVFRLMLRDPDGCVRRLAIEGLWENEDRALIGPFIELFNDDPDPLVRAAAALALGRFVVLNEFGTMRPGDADRVLAALRGVIDDPLQPVDVRARAVEAAGAASAPWATEMIWRAYDADEPVLQLSAIHAMGRNGDPNWLATLSDEMVSEDPQRRYEASHAAGQIGDEDAIPQLADLIEDMDSEVQESAIAALGEIGGDLAVGALREHLPERQSRVAEAIRAALADADAAEGVAGAEPFRRAALLEDDEDE